MCPLRNILAKVEASLSTSLTVKDHISHHYEMTEQPSEKPMRVIFPTKNQINGSNPRVLSMASFRTVLYNASRSSPSSLSA